MKKYKKKFEYVGKEPFDIAVVHITPNDLITTISLYVPVEKRNIVINSLYKANIPIKSVESSSISIEYSIFQIENIQKILEVLVINKFLSKDFASEIAANYPDGLGGRLPLKLFSTEGLLMLAASRVSQIQSLKNQKDKQEDTKPISETEKQTSFQFLLNLESSLAEDKIKSDEEKLLILMGGIFASGITVDEVKKRYLKMFEAEMRRIEESLSFYPVHLSPLYKEIIKLLALEKPNCNSISLQTPEQCNSPLINEQNKKTSITELQEFISRALLVDDDEYTRGYNVGYLSDRDTMVDMPQFSFFKNTKKKDTYCGFEPGFLIDKSF